MPRATRARVSLPRLLGLFGAALLVLTPTLARAQTVDRAMLSAASSASPCPATSCLEVVGMPAGVTVEIRDTASGTWTAQFEWTLNGATWTAKQLTTGSGSAASSATAGGMWSGTVGARFRVRLSAYSSGAVDVRITPLNYAPTAAGGGAGGTDGVAQASSTSGQSGVLSQCATTTGAPTYTTGTTNPCSTDVNGALRVAITSGAGSGGTALADRTGTFTAGTTSFTPTGGYMDDVGTDACTENAPCTLRVTAARAAHVNLAQVAGATVQTGSGTATGTQRVEIANNGTGTLATVGTLTTLSQFGGQAINLGAGATGTGTLRVTLPTDGTGVLATVGTVTSLSQFAGVGINLNAGAAGTGTLRVAMANDQPQFGTAAAAADTTSNPTLGGIRSFDHVWNGTTWDRTPGTAALGLTVNTEMPAAAALADATSNPTVPAVAAYLMGFNGTTWDRVRAAPDPCASGTKVYVNINQTTGTQLFAGTASNKTYVCNINLVTATAQNIALVSGTGTVCATGISGMMGGSTAATGWNLAANGGIVNNGGIGAVAKSGANADNVCLLQSSSGQISGNIGYVVAP